MTGREQKKHNDLFYLCALDLKLGIGVAATVFDRFDVRAAYNIGLLNRMGGKTDNIKSSLHTNVFQIGVAYNF